MPAGAIVAGWVLHPLKNAALARRTPITDILGFDQQTSLNRKSVIPAHDDRGRHDGMSYVTMRVGEAIPRRSAILGNAQTRRTTCPGVGPTTR